MLDIFSGCLGILQLVTFAAAAAAGVRSFTQDTQRLVGKDSFERGQHESRQEDGTLWTSWREREQRDQDTRRGKMTGSYIKVRGACNKGMRGY